jgi:hypothetical protein
MDLPKNEKSFALDHVGQTTGKKYQGTFTVKCALSMADKRKLEIEKTSLSADFNNPTAELAAISSIIANLRVKVIDAPDWFKQSIRSLDILDEDVYLEVFDKCFEKSEEWLSEVKAKSLGEEVGN